MLEQETVSELVLGFRVLAGTGVGLGAGVGVRLTHRRLTADRRFIWRPPAVSERKRVFLTAQLQDKLAETKHFLCLNVYK